MLSLENKKNALIERLSSLYAENDMTLEEYERAVERVHEAETQDEIRVIERQIQEKGGAQNEIAVTKEKDAHLAMFSWRSSSLEAIGGSGGEYTSLFGANRIIVNSFTTGQLTLHVNSIFGLTEIIVPKNIKIISRVKTLFSGVFISDKVQKEAADTPTLYITGKAVFGNVTVKTAD